LLFLALALALVLALVPLGLGVGIRYHYCSCSKSRVFRQGVRLDLLVNKDLRKSKLISVLLKA
jgi:hypothetical protein